MPNSDPGYDAGQVGVIGHGPGTYVTLGHIAAELRRMQRDGMTREAVEYAMDRVFMEDVQQPRELNDYESRNGVPE